MRVLAATLLLAGAAIAAAAPPAARVNDAAVRDAGYPATLAAYRFFTDAAAQKPAPGVTPYRLNTPLWTDGADKHRFVYVPPGQQAKAQGGGLLDLPVGSALIKTFSFGARKIETRVLLRRADGWVALPYQWNAGQTEARLALAGARIDLTTPAGRALSYAIPNKNQCKECHSLAGQTAPIGPKARNLSADWLAQFKRAGRLDAMPVVARRIPLWEARDTAALADSARGYLDGNCAHCHNAQGIASNSGLFLDWDESDPIKLGIGKRPVAAGRGSGNLDFDIAPGDPDHSILIYRMASLEGGVSMPEIGRSSLDPAGIALVRRWIAAMR